MNKEIKEALDKATCIIAEIIYSVSENGDLYPNDDFLKKQLQAISNHLRTIRTALEAYKPKTVPREFLDNALDLVSGCAAFGGGVHLDAFEEGLISLLENEDIEVEGDK